MKEGKGNVFESLKRREETSTNMEREFRDTKERPAIAFIIWRKWYFHKV